jgi:ribosome maturation factor RimP
MLNEDIVTQVKAILQPIADEAGAEIVEIIYKRISGDMVLRVLVDKADGISINECADINNKLGEALEKSDIIGGHYILEVSSPGLDRPIKDEKDFERNMGKSVRVSTYAPVDGKSFFVGKLIGLNEGAIVVETEEEIAVEIPRKSIAKCVRQIAF